MPDGEYVRSSQLLEDCWTDSSDDRGAAWALATVEVGGESTACLETSAGLYRLQPLLARVGMPDATSVLDLLQEWDRSRQLLDRAVGLTTDADVVVPERRLAPICYPGKVLCAGANYFDHLAEMGIKNATKQNQRPFFFMKPPRQAVVGEGDTVRMPVGTREFDWEVELAAVIGRTAREVAAEAAMQYVAGFTLAIDLSARDHNRAPDTFYKLDWVAGKAHDTCCPLGPRLVPTAAVGDPQQIGLQLAVNGALKQDGNTSGMVYTIAELISIASKIMTLEPGDVVLTGTPAGVGVPRGEFLAVGDRVTVRADRVGSFGVTIGESLAAVG